MTRETIYAALFAKLQTINTNFPNTFATMSRALKHYSDVDAVNQPALFMAQVDEDVTQTGAGVRMSGLFDKVIMDVKLYVYVYNTDQDPASTPWVAMNAILDKIHNLFKPSHGARRHDENLSGLVDSVRISGRILTDEGWLGPQAVAIVPLQITVTAT